LLREQDLYIEEQRLMTMYIPLKF